jgi:YggT family protein
MNSVVRASFALLLLLVNEAAAFVKPVSPITSTPCRRYASKPLAMDVASITETTNALSSAVTSSGFTLAETEAWVQPTALVLGPFLNLMSFAMLCRVVASWYPDTKLNAVPWIFVAWPTEPLLRLVKGVIPPAFGVDITPVFWVAIFTFLSEILLGQQGLLVMKMKYGI